MPRITKGFPKCFAKWGQRRSRGSEGLGSSGTKNEKPQSCKIHPETGDHEPGISQWSAVKQPSQSWLIKYGRRIIGCWRRPRDQDDLSVGPAPRGKPRSSLKTEEEHGPCPTTEEPEPHPTMEEPGSCPPMEESGCPEAGDPGAEMASSQDSVEEPPSASGSLPFEQDPTVIGDGKQPNVNLNHSESIETEAPEDIIYDPQVPATLEDINDDVYYPSSNSERDAELGEEQTTGEEQLPSVSDSVALEDDLTDRDQLHANLNNSQISSQDEYALNSSHCSHVSSVEWKSRIHKLCKAFFSSSYREIRKTIADFVAENLLDIFIQHVLEVDKGECIPLKIGILCSSKCNLDRVVELLICTIRGGPCSFPGEEEKKFAMKVKAIEFLATIVDCIPQTERLDKWIPDLQAIFSHFIAEQVLLPLNIMLGCNMTLQDAARALKIIDMRWKVMSSIFSKHGAFHSANNPMTQRQLLPGMP